MKNLFTRITICVFSGKGSVTMRDTEVPFAYGAEMQEYFARYSTEVKGKAISTAGHYQAALNTISRFMRERHLVQHDIYEIGSIEQLHNLWEIVIQDASFQQLNARGNRMYSAGYHQYDEFVQGHGFSRLAERLPALDVPMDAVEPARMEYKVWRRSGILRAQTIAAAGYRCELHPEHRTFIAERTQKPYMEAHHIIPMSQQESFRHSLDVYANVICLCPVCHRLLHHGLLAERRYIIDQIYEARKERFVHSGLVMGKEEFERAAMGR